jgi:hypothetical protein
MKMKIPVHKDIMGTVLKVGDYVAISSSNRMHVARVDKLCQKQIICDGSRTYSRDTILIEPRLMTVYLLTHDR